MTLRKLAVAAAFTVAAGMALPAAAQAGDRYRDSHDRGYHSSHRSDSRGGYRSGGYYNSGYRYRPSYRSYRSYRPSSSFYYSYDPYYDYSYDPYYYAPYRPSYYRRGYYYRPGGINLHLNF